MSVSGLRPIILSAFGPPALACLRSWGRAGMSPGMISIQSPGEPRPFSRYLQGALCLSREELFGEQGLGRVLQFIQDFDATGVTCIDENIAQWLNRQRHLFPEEVPLWLPSNEMLGRVLDKAAQVETARQVGLKVLQTWFFSRLDAIENIPAEQFPLCLRPSAPGSTTPSFKVKNVDSIEELRDFIGNIEIRRPVIGQPFKNLPNLVVHGTRTSTGTTIGQTGFLVERKFQGVSLTFRPVPVADDLKDRCAAFTEAMDLVGHYHFEFLFDPASEETCFLEINHRFGGTTAKALVCGYQEPLYALQAQGIQFPINGEVNNVTASSIKALIKSALYALTGRLTALDYPEESKLQRIWSTLKCLAVCKDEVFAWDDLPGTVAFYLGGWPAQFCRVVPATNTVKDKA